MKYPRTLHLPWSEGVGSDDKIMKDISGLTSEEVVVTEKLDGENSSLYRDRIHARSENYAHTRWRDYVRWLHTQIGHRIEDITQLIGENVYATHSIHYQRLTSYFYLFSVIREGRVLSWDETEKTASELGLKTVPVLYRGPYKDWDRKPPTCSRYGDTAEGYVVRVARGFSVEEGYTRLLAKYVRKGHVTTDKHWSRTWTPNTLEEGVNPYELEETEIDE